MIQSAFNWLFSTDPFMPHGFCLLWRPDLVWAHVVTDAIVAISYFTIPVFLIALVRRRDDLTFSWPFYCFGAFILLCGTTHLVNIVSFWVPIYGFEAVVKAATAIASIATAIAVWPLLPRILALPSRTALEQANAALETRVRARTAELEAANDQLKVMLQELHHRVKNNLQVVTSLLRLKQRQFTHPELRGALDRSIARIHAMSLVHEVLYSADHFGTMSVNVYLRRLVESIRRADPRAEAVDIVVDADETDLGIDQSIPLSLIANEVISNALKHAFRPDMRGRILVRLRSEGSRTRLEVIDDGIGAAAAESGPPGIGMQIVGALGQQIGGETRFDLRPDGAVFTLDFERRPAQAVSIAPSGRVETDPGLAAATA